jgi:hypothetical protein
MENNMIQFKLRFFLISLFFSFIAIGSLFAQTDSRLNGRWVTVIEDFTLEYRFNNGNFEITANGLQNEKGTYTTNSGTLVRTSTHIHGDFMNTIFSEIGIILDSKWYTINEFILAVKPKLVNLGLSEKDINTFVNTLVSSTISFPYSVDAKTLILTDTNGEVLIFSKK